MKEGEYLFYLVLYRRFALNKYIEDISCSMNVMFNRVKLLWSYSEPMKTHSRNLYNTSILLDWWVVLGWVVRSI